MVALTDAHRLAMRETWIALRTRERELEGLRDRARTADADRARLAFIVDETRTGFGQSGKMWAHDYWYLQDYDGGAPDMVTFGGKAGISGVYSNRNFRVSPTCSAYTQVVDMVKLINFEICWREIQRKQLLSLV